MMYQAIRHWSSFP